MQTDTPASPPLGGLSPAEFLDTYWQKKPLVVRDALPHFTSPLSPEELAGLALEEGVASRLIMEKGGDYPWQLRSGPFDEEDFLALPETHWTLLVQEVDALLPEVGALLNHFRFIPRWRIDDVMVSYAPEHGSVGAHIDNYDVFLLQGLGHRRWEIGHAPVEDEQIKPDLDVRMLDHFEPDETMVLGPGDMLYLPPRFAHYGVAEDDCMTYSIGFRAPSHRGLVGDYLSHILSEIDTNARYSDPDLSPTDHPGAIRDEARERVRSILRDTVADDAAIDRWFGQYITSPERGRVPAEPDEPITPEALQQALRDGAMLRRSPVVRVAYMAHDDGTATLFTGGDATDLDAEMAFAAPLLADHNRLRAADFGDHLDRLAVVELLAELVNDGVFELES